MGKRGPLSKTKINCEWSKDLAYAVGLIATDGCLIRGRYVVDVSSKDKEQLNNFSKAVKLNLKIGEKRSGIGKKSWRIQLNNRKFYEFLISIGLFPNKSKTLTKLNIPKIFFFDFLRGCFDGDGTFYSYKDKRWKSSFMYYLEFASASKSFILWLQAQIYRTVSVKGSLTRASSKSTYQLKFAKQDSRAIIGLMYPPGVMIYLSRKRLKINRILDTIG